MNKPQTTHGVTIARKPPKDNYISLELYSTTGPQHCMFRISRSKNAIVPPDLFDQIEAHVERAKTGTTYFVKEFVINQKHQAIAKHYLSFQLACKLLECYRQNLNYSDNYSALLAILGKALHAFNNHLNPHLVYLKSLYNIALTEGFPVKEDWFEQLPTSLKKTTPSLLNTPIAEQPTLPQAIDTINTNLENWLAANAEFLF